ncbi:MAG: hypothetical protein ACYDBS_01345 [Acidimicrobiales bacterium]
MATKTVMKSGAMALILGPLLLAACGAGKVAKDPPRGPKPSSAAQLCQSTQNVDRLVVQRSDAFPQNHMHFSFPSELTVSKASAVRNAARALCALPRMPSGAIACPADFGISYRLAFYVGNKALPVVGVDAAGCQEVRGAGAVRWVARSPGFWHTLGTAMGLPRPGYSTFRGTGPNG